MSISGSLEDVAVSDVLQFIHLGKRTGTLESVVRLQLQLAVEQVFRWERGSFDFALDPELLGNLREARPEVRLVVLVDSNAAMQVAYRHGAVVAAEQVGIAFENELLRRQLGG